MSGKIILEAFHGRFDHVGEQVTKKTKFSITEKLSPNELDYFANDIYNILKEFDQNIDSNFEYHDDKELFLTQSYLNGFTASHGIAYNENAEGAHNAYKNKDGFLRDLGKVLLFDSHLEIISEGHFQHEGVTWDGEKFTDKIKSLDYITVASDYAIHQEPMSAVSIVVDHIKKIN